MVRDHQRRQKDRRRKDKVTNLEEYVSKVNSNIFLREFTIRKNTFKSTPEKELEFADNVVCIDDFLMVTQLKERGLDISNSDDENKWFENKVLRKGVKQIKNTLKYIEENASIELINHRGHNINLKIKKFTFIIKLIIYSPNKFLSSPNKDKKFHKSSTAGLIHIMSIEDYLEVCKTMVTITEIAAYFDFREQVLKKEFSKDVIIDEKCLLGQYLSNDLESKPDVRYKEYHENFINNIEEFDISHILKNYADKIEYFEMQDFTDYYNILVEFAMLKRNELKEVKKRFELCLEIAKENEIQRPYRFTCPRTKCGFLFIPLEKSVMPIRVNALKNLTIGSKYDQKVDRQIGISFVWDAPYFLIDWCYLYFPWESNLAIEEKLKNYYPFRPLKTEILSEYKFQRK